MKIIIADYEDMKRIYSTAIFVWLINSVLLFADSIRWEDMSRDEELRHYYNKVKEDEKFYKWDKEKIIKTMEEHLYKSDDRVKSRKEVMDFVRAESALLYGDYFTKEEKYEKIMEYIYRACLLKPYSTGNIVNSTPGLSLVFEDINDRVKKVLEGEYGKNECFRKKMILLLAANKVGGRDIGDMLIEIFDKDKHNEFRSKALEVFVSNYSDYYTKEELMPYIKKLMKEPYFSICKACDVRPEGCSGLKFYPFRDTLVRLLIKYNIKFEYIQLDRCMIGGVPVLVDE